MEIALLQTDIAWGDKKVNLEQVEQLMNQHPGAQLYVLPEMFATGFMVGEGVAVEPIGGDVHRWMVQKATQKGCAVAGSVAVEENGRLYNRFYFITPDGITTSVIFLLMLAKTNVTLRAKTALWCAMVVCGFFCRCVTTCVSPCLVATAVTTMWPYMWPTGPRRAF